MPEALLVLEDGTIARGEGFGACGTTHGELVFNTAMTGYQEVLTDPSYRRQIVVMTTAHVGNYGVNAEDAESGSVQVAGFVVRELSRIASNHRAERSLPDELAAAGVVGIAGLDTRRLTRHLRDAGAMRAAVSTDVLDADALLAQVRAAPGMQGSDLATGAGTQRAYEVRPGAAPRYRVVAYDFGLKRNILRLLTAQGCAVAVVPGTTGADEALAYEPDGVFVSNGPGDPAAVGGGIAALRALLAEGVPTFGICLGHQLLGHAVGGTTYKLAFGHHGVNQPVRNLDRDHIEITSHNHGFAVAADSLPADGPLGAVRQTHVNLNDGVNEGLRCLDVPAFSVQYHPEAAPGTHDARYLFAMFTELMGSRT
jgi:carbamoyl-phosphate synthase small subunit